MNLSPATRLFAHLIDFGGDVDGKWIYDFFNNQSPKREWFKTYNKDKLASFPTYPYYAFMAVKDYYANYGDVPSFDAVCDLINDFEIKEITKDKVISWLKGCEDEKIAEGEYVHSVNEVRTLYYQNFLYEQVVEALDSGENDPRKAIHNLSDNLLKVVAEQGKADPLNKTQDMKDVANIFIKRLKQKEKVVERVPYPWKGFNAATGGGLGKSELTFILAPYSSGKSFISSEILYNIAENISPDEVVVSVDLEMRPNIVFYRYIARRTGIPINVIQSHTMDKMQRQLYKECLRELRNGGEGGNIIIIPKGRAHTCAQIRAEIEAARKGRKVVAIKIDHFSLLRPSVRAEGFYATREMFLELIELAEHYDAVGLVVGHLNKQEESQFQIIDQLADTVFHCSISEARQGLAPTPEDPYGKACQIDCKIHRGRSHASRSTLHLDARFSTATVKETRPERVVFRAGKLAGARKRNGKT